MDFPIRPILLQSPAGWQHFQKPVQVITAVSPQAVLPAIQEIETAVNEQNLFAAGYITYEAGAAFHHKTHAATEMPLLWFGLFQERKFVNLPSFLSNLKSPYQVATWKPAISELEYQAAISRIKEYIAQGYTYQVNYTFPLFAQFTGNEIAFFEELTTAQQGPYGAYLDLGRFVICSASPELFFRLNGTQIESRPMKGTAVRGRTLREDRQNMAQLKASAKNRAENVMIVDMVRNDLGQIAKIGTVQTPQLFAVERFQTVLQMTSTVKAETEASMSDILAHLFPCASITGAPKRSTMKIINELEPYPRGVYTGTVGFIEPGRKAQFNVAIRTVVIDREKEMAVYGVGSGIIWDSEAADEYAECQTKMRVLTEKRPSFDLLEALLWEPGNGYFLFDYHLNRLLASAGYFNIPVAPDQLQRQLLDFAATLTEPVKVRLQLNQGGASHIEAVPLAVGARPHPVRVGLAARPIHSDDIWLYHKTSRRQMYTTAQESRPDCDEVLLWNERGELTESSRSNLILELDHALYTPPVSSGLLAGTMRAHLIDDGRIQEKTLFVEDLKRCRQIFLINSVRKWETAVLVENSGSSHLGIPG